MSDGAGDRIRTFAADAVSAERLPIGASELIAVGWATVDTDRAVTQLANTFGISEDAFVPAAVSAALGARCRIAPA